MDWSNQIMNCKTEMYIDWILKTHLAKTDHLGQNPGPFSNTFSAVSAKPKLGVFVFAQISCDVFT